MYHNILPLNIFCMFLYFAMNKILSFSAKNDHKHHSWPLYWRSIHTLAPLCVYLMTSHGHLCVYDLLYVLKMPM